MPPIDDLLAYLTASPTPYHAAHAASARFDVARFQRLRLDEPWDELPPGPYQVLIEDAALVAFVIPAVKTAAFRLIGAHTDSPNFRLKPHAEYAKEGYLQLGVEVYGSAVLHTWLDRDLALAGRVMLRTDRVGVFDTRLFRLDQPRLRIPQLAVHLDREVNDKGLVLNKQEHLAPILGLRDSGEAEIAALAASAAKASVADVVHSDVMLYDTTPAALGGAHFEFIFAGRLDDLAMCHAGVRALVATAAAGTTDVCPVLALFEHEEVGSASVTGAGSSVLPRVLERISRRQGQSFDEHARALARSLCMSADMAHAVHPNHEGRHEPRHKPVLNGGPVLKVNAQQRYATSARSAAIVEGLCDSLDVPLQQFVNRTDLPCGSTIGPTLSTLLGMPTVDVGNPLLSMHSCREMGGTKDPALMERLMTGFFALGA
jgi:aspartyl aminopeptidase